MTAFRLLADRLRPPLRRLSRARYGVTHFTDILDLFDEQVYAGEITRDGHYVDHMSSFVFTRLTGGPVPQGMAAGEFWESCVHPEDWACYERFNEDLLAGRDAEATYRLRGSDGLTRRVRDRARPLRRADGSMLVRGIVSDVTRQEEAAVRLAETSDRFSRVLDVVGAHVYLAQALPDGRLQELFQGPGADRLLGGAEPDAEMENWEAAIHPDDKAAYLDFGRALVAGEDAQVEYRLTGADAITRWVHDRAVTHRRPDGTVEISGIVSDVSERRRISAELAQANAALSRVVESMDDHLYALRVAPEGGYRTVYRGPHREALTGGGLSGGEPDDRLWESLVHPDDRVAWRSAVDRLADGLPLELEYRVNGLDGAERIVLDRLRPRRAEDGTLYYDGATRDITEHRRLEDELRRARREADVRARTDELTGTFNRRRFAEVVAEALAEDAGRCGLLLLDADHFKAVNDTYGHAVGDAVLVGLARRLEAGLGTGDRLARWGGEEFAVLLADVGSDAELERRARRLLAAVEQVPVAAAAGVEVRLTVSIGATRDGPGLGSLDALVEAADRCLYTAKREGRNRVSLVPDAASERDGPGRRDEDQARMDSGSGGVWARRDPVRRSA